MKELEAIYHLYYKDIYHFILKLTGYQPELSQELAQETFYQAFISFSRFRGECEMKTWLCRIARNTYYRHVREAIKQRKLADHIKEQNKSGDVADMFEKRELYTYIREIVDNFKEREKNIVEYRLYSELPFKEIAILLGIKETTAKVTFFRAKMKIQQQLREVYGYEI